jgi:hypothetical protein
LDVFDGGLRLHKWLSSSISKWRTTSGPVLDLEQTRSGKNETASDPDTENGLPKTGRRSTCRLLPKIKIVNNLAIPLDFVLLKIIEESTALSNQIQEPMTRGIIVWMILQVLSEALDALRKNGNLHLGRARIVRPIAILVYDFLRFFLRNHCAVWVPL